MQSNNNPEDPEFEDILNIAYNHGELGNKNACLRPLLEKLIAREHRKTLEARIAALADLLNDMDTIGRLTNYAKIREFTEERIAELQSQLPKKEGDV